MPRDPAPRFAWHRQNQFRLLHNGNEFFPAMLGAIRRARRRVLLEIYLFESGRMADRFILALAAAARRKVKVRVMVDAVGSRGLADADRARLRRAGVELHVFNPLTVVGDRLRNLARDHRKLLVVDDDVAFVGGSGITDEFAPELRPENYWRETMLEIHGEVVQDWARLFATVWAQAGNPPFRTVTRRRKASTGFAQRGRVAIAHGPLVQDVKHNALSRIDRARTRVWLATPYFLPSLHLRRTLVSAARRGVDVRLILPGSQTDHPLLWLMSHHYYKSLLGHGIRIYEYQPRFIHSKSLVVDDWVSMGSCNFDRWDLRWNLEANQEVEDAAFAAETITMMARDMHECVEIDPVAWEKRWPLLRRMEAGLANAGTAIERWLDRF